MRTVARRWAAPAAAVFVLTATLTSGVPAGAGTSGTGGGTDSPSPTTTAAPTAPSAPRIELAAQDPWTPVGGDAGLRLALTNPPAGGTVSFSAYQALTARRSYDTAMLGGPLGSVLSQVGVPIDDLPVDALGHRVVTLGLQSPTEALDRSRLNVRRAGVYPLEVDLRDADDRTVATFRTALVVTEAGRDSVTERLAVAWVWPLTSAPSYLPSGEHDRAVVTALRSEGRLGRMALALRAVPEVPVTLAPTGETIEAWTTLAHDDPSIQTTAEALRVAVGSRQVLDGPYVPIDLPALLDHGLAEAVDEEFRRGTEALQGVFGQGLDRRTAVARPASTSSVNRLRAAGADRLVVDADALAPAPETRLTLAQPVTLGSEPVTALVTDPGLQELLTSDLPPALRAQLVLGGLAMVALEAPSVPRVVTLLNPDDFDPPAALLERLLLGLRDNPFVRPVTTAQAFDEIPIDPPAATVTAGAATSRRDLASVPRPEPAVSAVAYRQQRTRLNSFGALTRPGDPAVADADRSLLASVSSAWPLDIGRARADSHLHVVDRVIDDLVRRIQVPDPRTITLTSRSGEIPLTFRNETGHPIRLRASLASDKLFFPQGSVLELELPPRSTTVRVAVEARTSGTFPLDLEVTSTDGVLPVSQRRLEVRSTFVSTVGVVLMVSAAAFLALWWGWDLRRRHRRRRQPSAT